MTASRSSAFRATPKMKRWRLRSAICWIAGLGHPSPHRVEATAAVLIEHGADIHAVNRHGATSFTLAEVNGHEHTRELLIQAQRAKEKQEAEARFAAEVAGMHIAQRPIAVGHALRLRRGM